MPPPGPVAAVDCGTNSTRLLVAGADGATLARLMTITRLGAGVDRNRRLDADAIERTVAVLRRYRGVMDDHGVVAVRMTATSAARDAANRDEFFAAARDAVGTMPELLDGEEEGRLSFAGATAELDPATGPWLVADIGGGSTELACGSAGAAPTGLVGGPGAAVATGLAGGPAGAASTGLACGRAAGTTGPAPAGGPGAAGAPAGQGSRLEPVAVRSLDVGCVRVTERFFRHDPPEPVELRAAADLVAAQLAAATAEQPQLAGAAQLVGLAGTVAAAAALDRRLDHYDRAAVHHHRLRADVVTDLLAELAALDTAGRRARPGMEAERAGVIVGGLVVLDGLLRHFGMDECLTSESDILDGLVRSLLAPAG